MRATHETEVQNVHRMSVDASRSSGQKMSLDAQKDVYANLANGGFILHLASGKSFLASGIQSPASGNLTSGI
uniref:Uncharacterized protein n=1 Tax=Romanomermis culicivorax TaxID=13658 RepID=A0A915L895_ROMCU